MKYIRFTCVILLLISFAKAIFLNAAEVPFTSEAPQPCANSTTHQVQEEAKFEHAAPPPRTNSPTFHIEEPEKISFAPKVVRIIIYADDKKVGEKFKVYLNDAECRKLLSTALNVVIEDNPANLVTIDPFVRFFSTTATLTHVANPVKWFGTYRVFEEEIETQHDNECVVFAIGKHATHHVLEFLDKLFWSEMINSVILFNPTLAYSNDTEIREDLRAGEITSKEAEIELAKKPQAIPVYNCVSNRVYNFWTNRSIGWWRKIFPAVNTTAAELDANGIPYFKGVNICPLIIDEKGLEKDDFNFDNLSFDQFKKIIETIDRANHYRLQSDLNSRITNNTDPAIQERTQKPILKARTEDLPIVTIRHKLKHDEQNETIFAKINVRKIQHFGHLFRFEQAYFYKYGADNKKSEYLKFIKDESDWSDYIVQKRGLNTASVEGFSTMQENPFTEEKLHDEAIDLVQTKIETYELEKQYIEKRRTTIVEPALSKLCGRAPTRPINIAIVASGGGSRAMFATYGVLRGLHDMGVLDATSYICGLSGSTWAISSIFTELNNNSARNVKSALDEAIRNSVHFAPSFKFFNTVIKMAGIGIARVNKKTAAFCSGVAGISGFAFMTRFFNTKKGAIIGATQALATMGSLVLAHQYHNHNKSAQIAMKDLLLQPVTSTDYYGNGIAHDLLGKGDAVHGKGYSPNYLSCQLGRQACWNHKNMNLPPDYKPLLPFPIYTAAMVRPECRPCLYPWFEFTPYQIGTILESGMRRTGMFVKTWAFGRKFDKGRSTDYAPEQPLEYYLGIFSSAMNANIKEAAAMGLSKEQFKSLCTTLDNIPLLRFININERITVAKVFNPMYQISADACPHQFEDHSLFKNYREDQTIGLLDAGLAFNLPFPPLNDYGMQRPERKPDVIIFIDSSADDLHKDETVQAWPNGDALRDVETYARDHTVPFPKIPVTPANLALKTCSIFGDPSRIEPVVIYLPLTKDSTELTDERLLNEVKEKNKIDGHAPDPLIGIELDKYPTRTTGLPPQDSVNLVALMHYNVLHNQKNIIEAIRTRAMLPAAANGGPAAS